MPRRGPEISYELRCCIVCLHCLLPPPQNTFVRIGPMLGVNSDTCKRIWQSARRRAGCDDFKEVLAYVGRLDRSGRPPRVVDGTQKSAEMRSLIINLNDKDFSEIANI